MALRSPAPGRRVGQLAKAAGLTVRTLHYYEEIGLLRASGRTEAGHRLYSDADVERLYRISLLRRLGLRLEDIARALDDPAWNLRSALGAHLQELDRRLEAIGKLRARIAPLVAQSTTTEGPNTDDLLTILEEMTMLDTTVQRRIALLVYRDLQGAYDYLVRVFGLGPGQLTNDDQGRIVHGELQAGDGMVWLHPELASMGLSSPVALGASTACMAVMVDDVDAHFRHASDQGAAIAYEPVDQPYRYREYGARDSEGHLWSFMKPLD
jgi:DNA-binding transcriptional MerR regulator/uncharacterized glyoxalase superfamily protein PhnB